MLRALKLSALLFCASLLPLHAQTPQPPAATILHVSRITTVFCYPTSQFVRLFGTIDGHKVELQSSKNANNAMSMLPTILEPGDYPAQLTHDEKKDGGIRRSYDLELPGGKHATYDLVGLSE